MHAARLLRIDRWRLLQRLRNRTGTALVRVFVCGIGSHACICIRENAVFCHLPRQRGWRQREDGSECGCQRDRRLGFLSQRAR